MTRKVVKHSTFFSIPTSQVPSPHNQLSGHFAGKSLAGAGPCSRLLHLPFPVPSPFTVATFHSSIFISHQFEVHRFTPFPLRCAWQTPRINSSSDLLLEHAASLMRCCGWEKSDAVCAQMLVLIFILTFLSLAILISLSRSRQLDRI